MQDISTLITASQKMFGAISKIFILLNLYAKNPWGDGISAHSPHGILGQVYGDLAAHHAEFKSALEPFQETDDVQSCKTD